MTRERGDSGVYNVVVIGGGTAGLVTAAGTAALGGRVALIERGPMGGECLNTGCVPSKALIASARVVHQIRHAAEWGVESPEPRVDFDAVFARMRARRAAIAPHDSAERFESLGVEVIRGSARFSSPREVVVEAAEAAAGRRLASRNFVIATGSRAAVPSISGLEETGYYTNETVFDELRERPERLVILGGGPMGCELAQFFARLGTRVTLVQRSPRIMPREDPDAADLLRRCLEADGVTIRTGTRIASARRSGDEIRLAAESDSEAGRALACDALLLAAGRVPNVEGLELERAGVAFTPSGVTVNAYLQTSRPHIYAAGDVTGLPRFTHVADSHARTVVRNVLFPWWKAKREEDVVPWCTYTSPEVAHVGLNEDEARRKGIEYDVYTQDLAGVDRAVLEEASLGFAKVLTPKGGDRILGVTLVCERAGDLVSEFALAMKNGIGLDGIARTIHPYPTFSEIARKLADQRLRSRLTPAAKRLFGWLYRRRRGD